MKLFTYGGSFFYYMEKIFDIIALSVLWLIFCIPLVTIGASTAALYYAVGKAWKQNKGYVTKEFLHGFRVNFKPATGLWIIIAGLTLIFQLNLGIIDAEMQGNIGIFFLIFYGICLFVTMGVQLYAFPALSRFDMPAGWIMKLSLYLCFRHLFRTLALVAMTLCAFGVVYYFWPAVLIVPSLTHYFYHYLLEPVLKQHMPENVPV